MTLTPPSPSTRSEPEAGEPGTGSGPLRIPAQVIRRPAGSPPPVPSPRTDTPSGGIPQAPAGLPSSDEPGLYRPQPTGTTEPLAGWALLAGLLLPPLGVVLGIVALVRIRRRASNGRGLAVAGIVVGALVSAVMVLVLALSALVSLSSDGAPSDPLSGPGGAGGSGAVSQTCSGSVCTVTGRGAPLTIDGIGPGGTDGISVLAVGEGSATVASPQGPMEVPTGTALELGQGTQVVLTQAGADTVVFVYSR